MEFRILDKSDSNLIFDIDQTAFQDYWSADTFLEELSIDTRCYIGMFEDENMLGYIGLNIIFDECDIIRVAVKKEYQGKGYSIKLFEYVFSYLKSNNICKIMLEVSDKNEKAINLYTKIGFEKIFVRPNYYHDNSDALIFEKYL